MRNFAVIEKGVVTNIAVAESIEVMGLVLPDAELVLEITDATGQAYVGYEYRKAKNRFVPIRPAQSWSFNEKKFEWEAPVAYPDDGGIYFWNEEIRNWEQLDPQVAVIPDTVS